MLCSFDLTSIVLSAYLRTKTDTSKKVLYNIDDWLKMRQNYKAYCVFYTKFVRAVVGKRPFRSRLRSIATGGAIATVSDEALTLLGIENSCEMWNDVYKKSGGKIRSVRTDETVPDHWKSTVLPKYTRTSKSDPNSERTTEDKKWSNEGIGRFNALRELIKQDRAAHPRFKTEWLTEVRDEMRSNVDADLDDVDDPTQIDATDDLFDETNAPPPQPVLNAAKLKLGTSDELRSDDDSSLDG